MTITINGDSRDLRAPITIDELLTELRLRRELVAVELNRQLVRRLEFSDHLVADGDQLEIVEFVGGG
jgi:thiamine biosynthesis protein ThiS